MKWSTCTSVNSEVTKSMLISAHEVAKYEFLVSADLGCPSSTQFRYCEPSSLRAREGYYHLRSLYANFHCRENHCFTGVTINNDFKCHISVSFNSLKDTFETSYECQLLSWILVHFEPRRRRERNAKIIAWIFFRAG